ncbi:MAG TPA: DUF4118 domain-containing protein [Flavobacteriales bacterium]|nr:DUF4118 domain-containing protein [Flavobacteriales bacterium]
MLVDRSYLLNYVVALFAVLVALMLRFLMDPVLGDHLPYHAFYFAIAAVAAWRGLGPGLVALAIAFVMGNYFFANPRYTLDLFDEANLLGTFRFVSVGLLVAVLGHWGRVRGIQHRLRMDAQEHDLARTQQERARTQQLLASIGDGLITVDLHGRVTFMNQVAEQLCGWTAESAKGLPLEQVFPLIDTGTRAPVKNPALHALEQGVITLLPDNVSLITRDGTERAIDDSGAPIRDEQGHMTGSVLIFRDITERRKLEAISSRTSFTLGGLYLHALDDMRQRLSTEEREQLELACRAWIAREWRPNEHAVRLVALRGFNLILRQERSELGESGLPVLFFSVAYERLPS